MYVGVPPDSGGVYKGVSSVAVGGVQAEAGAVREVAASTGGLAGAMMLHRCGLSVLNEKQMQLSNVHIEQQRRC